MEIVPETYVKVNCQMSLELTNYITGAVLDAEIYIFLERPSGYPFNAYRSRNVPTVTR
jgi:hypothetical protein